jgi:hypothetical protein
MIAEADLYDFKLYENNFVIRMFYYKDLDKMIKDPCSGVMKIKRGAGELKKRVIEIF